MVDVLVGEDHQLDVLQPVSQTGDPALQLVEAGARVGAGVDESERVVVDQVHVHPAHRERRGNGEAVDPRLGGGGEGVGVGHGRGPYCHYIRCQ